MFHILTQFKVTDLDPIFSDGHALLSWSLAVKRLLNNLAHIHIQKKQQFKLFTMFVQMVRKDRNKFISNIDMQEVLLLHAKLDTVSVSTVNVNKITEDISQIFKYSSQQGNFFRTKI